jgi:hypothetical protein
MPEHFSDYFLKPGWGNWLTKLVYDLVSDAFIVVVLSMYSLSGLSLSSLLRALVRFSKTLIYMFGVAYLDSIGRIPTHINYDPIAKDFFPPDAYIVLI